MRERAGKGPRLLWTHLSDERLVVMMPGLIPTRPQPLPAGPALEAFFGSLPRGRVGMLGWLARHPRSVARAARSIGALPVLEASPTASPDGRALAAGLARRSAVGRRLVGGTTSVIRIPDDLSAYIGGQSRRTMRKQRNEALREGAHWVRVDDPEHRQRLLQIANDVERTHPDDRYRTASPDNRDLLSLAGWWLALSAADEPLVLAVAAIDRDWAMLRYFRVLDRGQVASRSRFVLMEVLIRELAALGVRVLATDMSPLRMSTGLREFQHRVGFELVRITPRRSRP